MLCLTSSRRVLRFNFPARTSRGALREHVAHYLHLHEGPAPGPGEAVGTGEAAPLAGALRMQYRRFLVANVLGGICWAAGTTFAVYLLGIVAERWLARFSWIGLAGAVAAGLTIGYVIRRRTERLVADGDEGGGTGSGRGADAA